MLYAICVEISSRVHHVAARLLANLLVMGSGIMVRAFAQAYRQALANASKSGVAHETVQNIRRGSKMVSEPEARQILGITEHSTWEEILQKYDKLFENNAKNGSFYLQSKVHRAKECLEEVYQKKAEGNDNSRLTCAAAENDWYPIEAMPYFLPEALEKFPGVNWIWN
ncbi:hypothetical protein POTOM_043359 [Populus tomentosa]|uniref:Uncharacterized protein n=1 Tax=Populus tomentosa TaxID=118781 RepID=A0A8X8CGL7_POPTO|nr:hypothetical protein POTOM_043359 [Populus tomentosa]